MGLKFSSLLLLAGEHSIQEGSHGALVPTALDSLSSQHSAVFLLGCQVMRLLANCPLFPSVILLLAKSIPISSNPPNKALLEHCSGDFYFDTINQILYLSETKLQHVGHFIATIVQSMAHIASGNQAHGNGVYCGCVTVLQYHITNLAIIFESTKYVIFFVIFQNNIVFSSFNPGSKPRGFMQALHEAISVLGLQLFKLSFQCSKEEVRECSKFAQ